MTWFDLIIIAVLAASTAFAVIRGALKEIGTLAVLGGAAASGWFLARPTLALFSKTDSFLTLAAVGGVIALLAFGGLYFLLHIGLRRLPMKGVSARTDRIAGGVFGAVRGLALIGLGFLAYGYYLDESRQPNAVTRAFTLPLAQSAAGFFQRLAPPSTRDIDSEGPKAGAQEKRENAAADGYGRSDRTALSEIVSTVTTNDAPAKQLPGAEGDVIARTISDMAPE